MAFGDSNDGCEGSPPVWADQDRMSQDHWSLRPLDGNGPRRCVHYAKHMVEFIAFCTIGHGLFQKVPALHEGFCGDKSTILQPAGSEIAKVGLSHQFTNGKACAF